ncbi:sensor histidine kinase [Variovorax sp. 22077]|uniref:sensor histidine kinase n=1 Tax=Variovorax sp. 22077 TaxID=3453867 RepID=UPI003F8515F2
MNFLSVAAKAIARRIRRWLQPSLVRRLLFAQIAVAGLLWSATLAFFLYDSNRLPELVRYDRIFLSIMACAQNLAFDPARQQQTLKAFDMALQETSSDFKSDQDRAPVLQVWQQGRLIYNSTPSVPLMHTQMPGRVERVRAGERVWRARAMTSPLLDTRVLLAEPDVLRLNFTIEHRSYYLLPLAISLPFIVFPAWLSVMLALRPWRPWRQVTKETAERGPADLSPLTFEPPHKELQPLVNGINGLLRSVRDRASRERGLIADAANELRTPLDAMRMNVEALKAQTADPGQRELMANLLRSNDRAARLVGQLQQLMRSDEMPRDASPATLAFDELVQYRIRLVEALARARGIALEFTHDEATPVAVHGERESLISMAGNLVENAIKYSPDGGMVKVRVWREASEAVLQVTDEGPGIPPALRERVFDRFFRNPDQTQSGSGLGLAIVRSVLEKHGGRIALSDGEGGRGLCATVWLPSSG